jgi:hypothetical protein
VDDPTIYVKPHTYDITFERWDTGYVFENWCDASIDHPENYTSIVLTAPSTDTRNKPTLRNRKRVMCQQLRRQIRTAGVVACAVALSVGALSAQGRGGRGRRTAAPVDAKDFSGYWELPPDGHDGRNIPTPRPCANGDQAEARCRCRSRREGLPLVSTTSASLM